MAPLRHPRLWLFIGLCLLAVLAVASLLPVQLDRGSFRGEDKLLHLLAYGAVTAWFLQIFHRPRAALAWVAAIFTLSLGMEVLQHWFPPRSPDPRDLLANTLGIGGALLLSLTPLRHTLQWLERRIWASGVEGD